MTNPKRQKRVVRATRTKPTPFLLPANGPWKEIDGKWVEVDEIVTESFILRRVPAKKLRSKTRFGAQR